MSTMAGLECFALQVRDQEGEPLENRCAALAKFTGGIIKKSSVTPTT